MWIAVDNCGFLGIASKGLGIGVLSACSACAGDYEDPDRTSQNDEDGEESAERVTDDEHG